MTEPRTEAGRSFLEFRTVLVRVGVGCAVLGTGAVLLLISPLLLVAVLTIPIVLYLAYTIGDILLRSPE